MDKLKHIVRKYSKTAQLNVIRLILRLSTMLNFRLEFIDVKGAYLQRRPITRSIHVIPPVEASSPKGTL